MLIVRDPRSVLCSFVHFVQSRKSHPLYAGFRALRTLEERYKAALHGQALGVATLQPLRVRCEALNPWLESPDVLTIRFEDMVGHEGGGSETLQAEALTRLKDWVEADVAIAEVQHKLFGAGRHTFRRGRVDSWAEEIPAEIGEEVETELRDIIVKWGYR